MLGVVVVEHQLGEHPYQCVDAVGTAAFGKSLRAEVAHLVFERRKFADVNDAGL